MKKPLKPMPGAAGQQPAPEQPTEPQLAPPLAEPVFVDDVAVAELLTRYQLHPLVPLSKFEYQLICLAAGLEQRIRELDPDAQ